MIAVCCLREKVIYIARNAKDVSVSYYHFYRMMSMVKYHGNFTDFCKLFTSGRGNRLHKLVLFTRYM